MNNPSFYLRPVVLSRNEHRQAKVQPEPSSYAFAAGINSVPLVVSEFAEAAKEYPIVFVQAKEVVTPVALLGLRGGENIFVDSHGNWNAGYIPAFIRRYPFVLSEDEPRPAGGAVVCVDESYSGFGDVDGEALFDEDGNHTDTLHRVAQFLKDYHRQQQETRGFAMQLKRRELMAGMDARVDLADGRQLSLAGMYVVDERKVLSLDDKDVLEYFREGGLPWIYFHLMSLSNMSGLAERIASRAFSENSPSPAEIH